MSEYITKEGIKLSMDGTTVIGFDRTKGVRRKKLIIPSGVRKIEDDAFEHVEIISLYLPKELEEIGQSTLVDVSGKAKIIEAIEVEAGNKFFYTDGEGLYGYKGKEKVLLRLYNHKITKYIAPIDVKGFVDQAFVGCRFLESVHLSECMDSFNEYAFPNDTKVKNIFIPKNIKKMHLKSYEDRNSRFELIKYRIDEENEIYFQDEDSIYEILDDGTYKLVSYRYNGKGQVFILDNTSVIGENSFRARMSLDKVKFPKTIHTIEAFAFAFTDFKSITIPKNVKRIERGAFGFCRELKKVSLPKELNYIDEEAFMVCMKLNEVKHDKFVYNNGLIKANRDSK